MAYAMRTQGRSNPSPPNVCGVPNQSGSAAPDCNGAAHAEKRTTHEGSSNAAVGHPEILPSEHQPSSSITQSSASSTPSPGTSTSSAAVAAAPGEAGSGPPPNESLADDVLVAKWVQEKFPRAATTTKLDTHAGGASSGGGGSSSSAAWRIALAVARSEAVRGASSAHEDRPGSEHADKLGIWAVGGSGMKKTVVAVLRGFIAADTFPTLAPVVSDPELHGNKGKRPGGGRRTPEGARPASSGSPEECSFCRKWNGQDRFHIEQGRRDPSARRCKDCVRERRDAKGVMAVMKEVARTAWHEKETRIAREERARVTQEQARAAAKRALIAEHASAAAEEAARAERERAKIATERAKDDARRAAQVVRDRLRMADDRAAQAQRDEVTAEAQRRDDEKRRLKERGAALKHAREAGHAAKVAAWKAGGNDLDAVMAQLTTSAVAYAAAGAVSEAGIAGKKAALLRGASGLEASEVQNVMKQAATPLAGETSFTPAARNSRAASARTIMEAL